MEKTEALLAYVEFTDRLIVATALSSGMKQIVTRNSDHFKRIDGIIPVAPEDLEF